MRDTYTFDDQFDASNRHRTMTIADAERKAAEEDSQPTTIDEVLRKEEIEF